VTSAATKAVIDVGTNSIKLLIGRIEANSILPLYESSKQTRLGRGFYETNLLLSDAIAQTAEAVREFATIAREHGAHSIRVVATSAARDAVNRKQLLDAIETASTLKTEVITGEQEADLVFKGVATDRQLAGRKLLIVDVGGGSTELIAGMGQHHTFRRSFALGSVRLLEKLRPANPPTPRDLENCRARLKQLVIDEIAPTLNPALGDPSQVVLVGTGGTTTILARMEKQLSTFSRDEIEGTIVERNRMCFWMEKLWALPIEERKGIPGIPSNRADIIPMGVAIYEALMLHLNFPKVFVSTRGLRFGALIAND